MTSTPPTRRDLLKGNWLDLAKRVTGVIMTQVLPFADARALKLVYDALKTA